MTIRPSLFRAALPSLGLALLLGGCVVGPDYKGAPTVAPRAAAAGVFHRAGEASTAAPAARWWTALNDGQLNRLVETALVASPDVDVAQARLRQSRAGLQGALANRLPTSSANALYLRSRGTTNFLGAGAVPTNTTGAAPIQSNGPLNLYNVGFDATWELDFFGGTRRALESAGAQVEAYQADLEGAQVSLAAEVAQAYVSLRDYQQRLALSRRDAEVEARMVRLAQEREAGGTASALDVERLNNQLQSTRAALVPVQAQITEQLDRLAVLTGQEPGALDGELSSAAAVPLPPATVEVGDPAALLRRRPDIRAAERRLAQQNAVIGQRTADLFPKITLFGNIGFGSTDLGGLITGDSFSYLAAPVLRWSPFDFGRTRARITQAEAARDEALATYRRTVLIALGDAETALSRYAHQRDSVVGLARVAASADRVAAFTELRVRGGTATTLDVLDAERRRLDAQNGLAQAEAQLTQDYIALQKSLGLGWLSPNPA